MEKTPAPAPVNGGRVCATCRHLDKSEPQAQCRRFPPQMVGGLLMLKPPGALNPEPMLMTEGYWPKIGQPQDHWCGEWDGYTMGWKNPLHPDHNLGVPF